MSLAGDKSDVGQGTSRKVTVTSYHIIMGDVGETINMDV